jgi:hypothetical protein
MAPSTPSTTSARRVGRQRTTAVGNASKRPATAPGALSLEGMGRPPSVTLADKMELPVGPKPAGSPLATRFWRRSLREPSTVQAVKSTCPLISSTLATLEQSVTVPSVRARRLPSIMRTSRKTVAASTVGRSWSSRKSAYAQAGRLRLGRTTTSTGIGTGPLGDSARKTSSLRSSTLMVGQFADVAVRPGLSFSPLTMSTTMGLNIADALGRPTAMSLSPTGGSRTTTIRRGSRYSAATATLPRVTTGSALTRPNA